MSTASNVMQILGVSEAEAVKIKPLYKCYKCKSRRTKTRSVQNRSADEPAATVVTCLNTKCRNRWIAH